MGNMVMVNNLGEEAGICPKCGARMYYDEICSTDENGNEISCVAPRCFGCNYVNHPMPKGGGLAVNKWERKY